MQFQKTSEIKLSVVVPVFKEESNIAPFLSRTIATLTRINESYEVVFVLDPSPDRTEDEIVKASEVNARIKLIKMSRRFGQPAATMAGLHFAIGESVVVIDADLQDPIELIPTLIERWEQTGADVVLARRKTRDEDTIFRRTVSALYISVFRKLSGVDLHPNVGEFRLMSRAVVEAFSSMPERQRFVRGMLAWLGFKVEIVDYIRPARAGGKSSFNLFRLFELGVQGITAFSIKPLRMATIFGLITALGSGIYAIFIFAEAINNRTPVPGYASLLITVLFLGGMQLLFLGIIGEYLGRVLLESKARPNYVIRKVYKGNGR